MSYKSRLKLWLKIFYLNFKKFGFFWFKRVLHWGPEQRESKLSVLCLLINLMLISYMIIYYIIIKFLIMENHPHWNRKQNLPNNFALFRFSTGGFGSELWHRWFWQWRRGCGASLKKLFFLFTDAQKNINHSVCPWKAVIITLFVFINAVLVVTS